LACKLLIDYRISTVRYGVILPCGLPEPNKIVPLL